MNLLKSCPYCGTPAHVFADGRLARCNDFHCQMPTMRVADWENLPERMTKNETESLCASMAEALATVPRSNEPVGEFDCVICRVQTVEPGEDLCAGCNAQMNEELDAIMNMSDGEIIAQWQAENPGQNVEEFAKKLKDQLDETLNGYLAAKAMRQRGDTEPS